VKGLRLELCAGVAALVVVCAAPAARQDGPNHVTVFGDSVATALYWGPAYQVLQQGIDLDLEAAACRRIEDTGCDVGEGIPDSVFTVAQSQLKGNLGDYVVMIVGYNEFADSWGPAIQDAINLFKSDGVKKIFWLTYREGQHQYIYMNDRVGYYASFNPSMVVLDWNAYSRSHDDWFQGDGLHLTPDGAIAMATFIHSALIDNGVAQQPSEPTTTGTAETTTTTAAAATPPAVVTARLPKAVRNHVYKTFLSAKGGKPPYHWQRASVLPHNLVLASDGLLTGILHVKAGDYRLKVTVSDASGRKTTRRLVLQVS
jgi:hypothetical protein